MSEESYESRLQRARMEHSNALLDEKDARESGNLQGVRESKQAQINALAEISRLENAKASGAMEREQEESLTVVGPNPRFSGVDNVTGVRFENGVAEDVPRSIAARFLELEGCSIEE